MKKVLAVLLVLIAGVLAFVATRPGTFHVERKVSIAAPAETIAVLVSDFHRWGEWSPWDKLDPAQKKTYDGGPGVGAKYTWVGNDKVGEGAMAITEATPERIALNLEFIKPFEAKNRTSFTFAPAAGAKPGKPVTEVTWALEGRNNFMSKAMQVFKSMDSMIGKDFESGLEALKTVAEAEQVKVAKAAEEKAAAEQKAAADKAAADKAAEAKAAADKAAAEAAAKKKPGKKKK
jgi:hypothetical protein